MKALIQRVRSGRVSVNEELVHAIDRGHVVLLGCRDGDTEADARQLAYKTLRLRVFPDDAGRMNRSLLDIGGKVLVISQFTLYADTHKGHRPSFIRAGDPDAAEALYREYVAALRAEIGEARVGTGRFGASMLVEIVNDGPVTIELTTD